MKNDIDSVLFFSTPTDFRNWLTNNHNQLTEQWVGYYKKGSGRPSITWPESVDEALCFGWIDGLRKKIDDESYKIRFTPRKANSHWSAVNIKRVKELQRSGQMQPAGMEVFKKRKHEKSAKASYEQLNVSLDPRYEKQLKGHPDAWEYWTSKPPSYKKQVSWWIMSAKKEETRQSRTKILIESSAKNEVIPPLRWSKKK